MLKFLSTEWRKPKICPGFESLRCTPWSRGRSRRKSLMKFPRPVDSDVFCRDVWFLIFASFRHDSNTQTKRVYGLRRVPSAVLPTSIAEVAHRSAGIRRSQDCSHIVLASNIAESSLTLPLEFRTCRDRADIGLIGMGVDLVACCERQGPMSVQSSTWPSDVRSSSLLRANIVLSWCCNHSEWSVKNKIEQNNYHQLPSTLIKNSKNAKNLRTYLTYWKQNTKYRNLCWAKVQVQRKPLRRWLHQREHSSMSWGAENIFSV
jgi:hypothetical protein